MRRPHLSNRHKNILLVIGVASLFASIFGWYYSLHGNASGFSPQFFPLGIFTWDDGMIIGTLLFFSCIFLRIKNSSVLSGLFFSVYAFIRSAGEVVYNLNAQFSPISRPWEAYLPSVASRFHLQLVELFVIAQVFFMVLCIVSFLIFLSFLKEYLQMKK